MHPLQPAIPGISEEEVAHSAPLVRALVVQRLEQIWATCAPHVDGSITQEGYRPDPRFVEAGLRVLDRLATLYRLAAPIPAAPEPNAGGVDVRDLIRAQLRELEERSSAS